jgi:hypothetical protein
MEYLSTDGSFSLIAEGSMNLIRRVELSSASVRTFAENTTTGSLNGIEPMLSLILQERLIYLQIAPLLW